MMYAMRNAIVVICLALLLLGCGNGSDRPPPAEPGPWGPVTPVYADNGVPGELDIITRVPMGEIPICWQPPTKDINGEPFLEGDQLLFWVFANRVSARDPDRRKLKELEAELYLEQVVDENGQCCLPVWLDEDGEWAIGIMVQLVRYGVWVEAEHINWSDEIENQGLAGLWRVCNPNQMPPEAATEVIIENIK